MKKHIHSQSEEQRNFIGEFMKLVERRSSWEVWADWVEAVAITISVPFEFRPKIREERAQTLKDILGHYSEDEIKVLDAMFEILVDALDSNPEQDFLGTLFQELNLSNHWKGQFFTPYSISYLSAEITTGNLEAQLQDRRWVDVLDPCSGAGVFFIAARNCMLKKHWSFNDVLFVGQDVDKTAALMGYIQISLLGCAGYIVVGNSLTDPVTHISRSSLIPAESDKYDIWFTPIYRSPVWEYRRCSELLMLQTEQEKRGIESDEK